MAGRGRCSRDELFQQTRSPRLAEGRRNDKEVNNRTRKICFLGASDELVNSISPSAKRTASETMHRTIGICVVTLSLFSCDRWLIATDENVISLFSDEHVFALFVTATIGRSRYFNAERAREREKRESARAGRA